MIRKDLSYNMYHYLISLNQSRDMGWTSTDKYSLFRSNRLFSLKKKNQSLSHSDLIEMLDVRYIDKTRIALKEQAYRIFFKRKFPNLLQNLVQEKRTSFYINIR